MRALRFMLSLPFAGLAWLLFADLVIAELVHGLVVDAAILVRGRRS